jgi:5-methylcytosine-specific restriction endonuclease McrA
MNEDGTSGGNVLNHSGKRYRKKKTGYWGKFDRKLVSNLLSRFNCVNNSSDLIKCDEELVQKIKQKTDTDEIMSEFTSIITATSDAAFKTTRAGDRVMKGTTVPWWTNELTILRKRALALRRRYQRTRNDDNLRQERKLQYQEGKRHYQEEKYKSWKEFCSHTADSNPWNAVYKLASGKLQGKTTLSTLKTQKGTFTSDIVSTMEHMMEYFIPLDGESSDRQNTWKGWHEQCNTFENLQVLSRFLHRDI